MTDGSGSRIFPFLFAAKGKVVKAFDECSTTPVALHGKSILTWTNALTELSGTPWPNLLAYWTYRIRLFARSAVSYCERHPTKATLILLGTLGISVWVVAPLILSGLGFSATGPVASTSAAAWQASIGNVAAGSLFASLQRMAMGGAVAAVFVAVGLSGAAIATSALSWAPVTRHAAEIMPRFNSTVSSAIQEGFQRSKETLVPAAQYCGEQIGGFFQSLFAKGKSD